jgi:hypothetical protein
MQIWHTLTACPKRAYGQRVHNTASCECRIRHLQATPTSHRHNLPSSMADQSEILRSLRSINNSIDRLSLDQESMRDAQSQSPTMIAANFDILTRQLTGVVSDFTTLGDDVHCGFQNWSRDAIQTVVAEVLAIHGPRIDAIRGHISGFTPCTW